jgi:hypothetical protein
MWMIHQVCSGLSLAIILRLIRGSEASASCGISLPRASVSGQIHPNRVMRSGEYRCSLGGYDDGVAAS